MMDKTRNFDPTIKISVELEKLRGDDLYLVDHADYVFLSKTFAQYLGCTDKKEAVYHLKKLANRSNFNVICPWATDGAVALDQENNYYCCPSYPPERVVDTLGAGDTFCAATIFALNQKRTVKEAIEFGSKIAGAKVGFYGYDGIKEVLHKFL